jgi:uncharacterized protein
MSGLTLKRRAPALLVVFFLLTAISMARDIPDYQGFVSDYANVLSASEKASLETKLREFNTSTTTQIAVLTINSLEGEAIEDFGIRVAEKWKVGQKGLDNGAILIVAKDDHRLRIEVGYGLEGAIPDIIAGRIIDNLIVPEFKAGNFSGGIDRGVEAIMSAAKQEYDAIPDKPPTAAGRTGRTVGNLIYLLIMAAFLPLFILGGMFRRRRGLFWGGPFGGFFMGGGSFGGHSSSGGGSFSGFGGGSFGGGGASGSW